MKHDLNEKVNEALNSLEDVHRASPGPFFFTRVHARLLRKQQTSWEKITAIIARPVVAFSVICFVLTLNTVAIFKSSSGIPLSESASNATVASEEPDLDIIAFYDEENNNSDPQ